MEPRLRGPAGYLVLASGARGGTAHKPDTARGGTAKRVTALTQGHQ